MITAMARPFLLVCGTATFPMTSTDAQRLIDGLTPEYAVTMTPNSLTFTNSAGFEYRILPATLGGGPAFEVTQ